MTCKTQTQTEPSATTNLAVRSTNGGNWLFINNQLFRGGWARVLGPYTVSVYTAIAMHANDKQKAWPSYQTIAKQTGMSRRNAIRGVQTLAKYRIIRVEDRHDSDGHQETNMFTLLAPSAWICPDLAAQDSLCESPPPVTHSHPNKTQFKQKTTNKTHGNKKAGNVPDIPMSPYADVVVALLTEIGVVGSKLREIVTLAPPIECVEGWVRYAQTQALINPAGFVVEQILNGTSPPQPQLIKQRSGPMTAREIWEELQAEEETVGEPEPDESQGTIMSSYGDSGDGICSSALAKASIAPNLPPPGTHLWTMALESLRMMVFKSVFAKFFKDSHAVGRRDQQLIVAVVSVEARDWLAHRLMRRVLEAVSSIDPTVTAVKFVVATKYERAEEPLQWDLSAKIPSTISVRQPMVMAA